MANNRKTTQAAEKLFKQREKAAAMSDYERRVKAEKEKTARLRALRLAKEAADKEAAEQQAVIDAAEKKAAKAAKAAKSRAKAKAAAE